MTNLSLRLLVLVGALVLAAAALVQPRAADAATDRIAVLAEIDDYRTETWHWQKLMGARLTPAAFTEREATSSTYRGWLRDLWRKRALTAERRAARPPHRSAWMCIHRHERHPGQGWATHTGNGYYGGLQMDLSFQRSYGRRPAQDEGHREPLVGGRADVGRRARVSQRPRLLSVAEHGPSLRLDLILLRLAGAPLAKPQRHEDEGDPEHDQRLDDGAADAAVRDER